MSLTEIQTKSGRRIEIYDNLLPFSLITELYYDLRIMEYPLVTQNDTALQDYNGVFGFGKGLPKEFILSVLARVNGAESFPLKSFLKRCEPQRSWVNIYSRNHSTSRHHSDEGCKHPGEFMSLLYYANPKWELDWDGGTVFRSENLEEVECLVDYKPGRFVLFDSSIPHKIYQTSPDSHPYRFTINTVFKNYNLGSRIS